MKKVFLFVLLMGATSFVASGQRQSSESAQIAKAERVVQVQLEAYNRRDIEAFLNTYAADVKLYDHPDKLWASGLEQVRRIYSQLFKQAPKLNAKVSNRIVQGEFVIDQEVVTGLPDEREIKAVAIYQVKDGKIINVWFVR